MGICPGRRGRNKGCRTEARLARPRLRTSISLPATWRWEFACFLAARVSKPVYCSQTQTPCGGFSLSKQKKGLIPKRLPDFPPKHAAGAEGAALRLPAGVSLWRSPLGCSGPGSSDAEALRPHRRGRRGSADPAHLPGRGRAGVEERPAPGIPGRRGRAGSVWTASGRRRTRTWFPRGFYTNPPPPRALSVVVRLKPGRTWSPPGPQSPLSASPAVFVGGRRRRPSWKPPGPRGRRFQLGCRHLVAGSSGRTRRLRQLSRGTEHLSFAPRPASHGKF